MVIFHEPINKLKKTSDVSQTIIFFNAIYLIKCLDPQTLRRRAQILVITIMFLIFDNKEISQLLNQKQ